MTPAPDPDRRAAAAALGLPPDPDPAAARAAFLQRLADYDLQPPPDAVEAAAVLGVLPHADHPPAALERIRQRRLEADIDRFAADYWALPPADRRARFESFRRPGHRAAARLDRLRAGLDLFPPELTGPAGELARLIATLYPLPPAERAAVRRRRLKQITQTVPAPDLRRAAHDLRRDHPAWAALAPDLFDALPVRAGGTRPRRLIAFTRSRGFSFTDVPGWVTVVLIIFALSLFRMCINVVSDDRFPPPPSRSDAPRTPWPPPGGATTVHPGGLKGTLPPNMYNPPTRRVAPPRTTTTTTTTTPHP